MYPHVRQLTTRWQQHEPEPRSRAEILQTQGRRSASEIRSRRVRPRHKLVLLTWAGAYAVVTAILATLGPTLAPWPPVLRSLMLSVLMVVALTWLIMPALTRLLHPWLAPPA